MQKDNLIFKLRAMNQAIRKLYHSKIKEHGLKELNHAYIEVLVVIYNSDDRLTLSQIATNTGKDKSTVTVFMRKLERLGYVVSEKSTLDLRVTHVRVTQLGLDIKESVMAVANEISEIMLQNHQMDDLISFRNVVNDIKMNIEDSMQ